MFFEDLFTFLCIAGFFVKVELLWEAGLELMG